MESARDLVATAIGRGASQDVALGVLERIDRLQRQDGSGAADAARREPSPSTTEAADDASTRPRVGMLAAAALIPVAALAGWWMGSGEVPVPVGRDLPAVSAGRAATVAEAWPMPGAADGTLARARRLQQAGRLAEALRELDTIGAGDTAHGEAETVRASLQRALLQRAGLAGRARLADTADGSGTR